jgi:hypothetical protein
VEDLISGLDILRHGHKEERGALSEGVVVGGSDAPKKK